ncbi:DUF6555 family protein [Pseudomonas coleopterorum]|uniref:DUF6555 family protein n=1 Tax=Pseudomonas coleopterorum TaxID=1605838 RepID=UPI0039C98059
MSLYELTYHRCGRDVVVLVRCATMNDPLAWHWAACDAGVGLLLKTEREKTLLANRERAVRHGIKRVTWRKC